VHKVILDYAQEIEAHEIGLARVLARASRPDHAGRFNKAISLHEFIAEHAEAVASEMAVAQYFGIRNFRATLNTYKGQADVGSRIEVKWTKYENGSLIVNATDRAQDVAILVTGHNPYRLAGWIPIAMARQPRHLNAKQGNFWVTQDDLFPIQNLRDSVHGDALS
jgi:hypothetical protein